MLLFVRGKAAVPSASQLMHAVRDKQWIYHRRSATSLTSDQTSCVHAGIPSAAQINTQKPVYQDRQKLFNRIAPVYDQVSRL